MVRQTDFSLSACRGRATALGVATGALWKRRWTKSSSAFSSTPVLLYLANKISSEIDEEQCLLGRNNRISLADFSFNFNMYGDFDCLFHFRFTKANVLRMIKAVAWPSGKTCTSRNRYATSPLLTTCIVLRRLASPARWTDLEIMFGKRRPHLSEIYWEALEFMWEAHGHLLTTLDGDFLAARAETYAFSVQRKSRALSNCVGFIDGTVIGIARPKGSKRQRVVYNGHKRKHALKYQAVNTPDGLILHACGPIEGRRHDWTLYVRSGLDEVLPNVLEILQKKYCLYGDSGYNWRWYMEVPFQGSQLTAAQKAFNKAMSAVRISVEWIFKEVKMHFTVVDFKRKMKISESPIGLMFLCCMLLSNCRNCIYPNQISQYFKCPPPSLEDYLQLSE